MLHKLLPAGTRGREVRHGSKRRKKSFHSWDRKHNKKLKNMNLMGVFCIIVLFGRTKSDTEQYSCNVLATQTTWSYFIFSLSMNLNSDLGEMLFFLPLSQNNSETSFFNNILPNVL